MQEFDLKERDFAQTISELEERLAARKQANSKIANEYFNYQHKVSIDRQKLEDQIALAKVENETLAAEMDKLIIAEKIDGEYNEEAFDRKTK